MKNLSIFEPQIEKHYADKKTCILFFKVQNKFIKPADFEKQLENFYRNKIVFFVPNCGYFRGGDNNCEGKLKNVSNLMEY